MGALCRDIIFYCLVLCIVLESSSFCIINQSCKQSVFVEIWDRREQIAFPNGFQNKNITIGDKACCAASNNGCNYPNLNDEVFFWMHCGTGILQSVVACRTCDIIVTKTNTITVQEDDGSIRAVYACLAQSGSGKSPKDELK